MNGAQLTFNLPDLGLGALFVIAFMKTNAKSPPFPYHR
jgi:hypothetical protein